jgi:flagellar biosynthesis/type III secretory pathway protein FliH
VSSPDTIRFFQPLRAVRLVEHGPAPLTPEQIDVLVRDAHQRGYTEASAHVARQIAEQREEANHMREGLFRSLEDAVGQAVSEVRAALPVLTMHALRRVLSRVEMDRTVVAGIVEDILAEIGPDVGPIELRLHPSDLALVRGLDAQLAASHPGLCLVADEALARGDCQAVTRYGKVDARLSNKLEKLSAALCPVS